MAPILRTKEGLLSTATCRAMTLFSSRRNTGPIQLRQILDAYSYNMDAVWTRIILHPFDSALTRGSDGALGRSVDLGGHSYAKLLMRVDFRWRHPLHAVTRGLRLCAGVQSAARLRARILGSVAMHSEIRSLSIRRL